ncbi:glycoside hydrolase family 95 protein [Coralloluteibacterium stylophorae]|uniref:Glycoside hydrolase family 95 protein n=2 Tax=Coralloluteibacterium stylophorae TaxID=1776034 RepID=A0AAP2G2G7_9GAMM|nr:glycoside hydrolase family 95 protein [Coralloluteibacterium stylophorae]MBS7458508.1 glycoside hydrolase family 95 protein [Coralloluteibacterium stylophorae]
MLDLTRRQLLQAMAASAALAAPSARADGAAPFPDDDLVLRYDVPARAWVGALPLGNGRLGAMVWGGVARERLQINEDTLFAGGPHDPVNPRAREALPEVRRLIFAGRYAEAEALANEALMAVPVRQMPYQAPGDVWIDFDGLDAIDDYARTLDLDRAVATSRFSADGVTHTREAFVSPVDQCLVLRVRADRPGALSGLVSTTSELDHTLSATGTELLLAGRNGSRHGIDGALRFVLRTRLLQRGGTVSARDGRLRFDGADELVLLVACATSYLRYDDVSGDPDAMTRSQLDAAAARGADVLRADHEAEHRRLFRRVRIDLGRTRAAARTTDQRVERFGGEDDPALAALYFQYGRYLLISSSRPGSQPANLQGIWNDLQDPPWSSKWTLNINTEMNYWPAEVAALPECVEPLERMVFELAETGARTAREMYGAPGWVVHHNTDLWRQTAPIDGARFGIWPMGGAWLLRHLWDRWDYGRDPAYLARVYPLFRGAAEFFAAVLIEDPGTGELVTNPSLSPENRHPFGSSLCAGPAMDSQILRALFAQCIEAAQLLQVDTDFAARLAAIAARLPPDRIGQAGQLQEWREDWDLQAPEPDHRHVSHLYALHPGHAINVRDTPELAAAAKRSLQLRGDEATGWGIGWRINLWARLGDGAHAYRVLEMLLSHARTYPNLFDAHPPFQIDGNFGGAAGIAEMLLQDWGGEVFLLPALPPRWRHGRIEGLRLRGAAGIDIAWSDGLLESATVASDRGGSYRVSWRGRRIDLDLAAGERARVVPRADGGLVRA